MTNNWATPEPLNWTRGDVSALAARVAEQLGYEPGAPLEPVITKLDGQIAYGELAEEESESGSIMIDSGRFVIHIPLNTSPLRDRFTIAHELGHYVLHYLYPNQFDNRNITRLRAHRYGSGQAEYEANWFAAAFLMPADKFKDKYEELGRSDLAVADYFKVSPQAAAVRAKSLGLQA